MHTSVLLTEILAFFKEKRLQTFVDGTLGAAGHTKALMAEHQELVQVIGFDQDTHALEIAKKTLHDTQCKVQYVHENFVHMTEKLHELGILSVDGILLDLGVSSMQLDVRERGLSFMGDGPLDMRMGEGGTTAADIINRTSERDLANIFFEYGEEFRSRKIAAQIAHERKKRAITTTLQLVEVIEKAVGRHGKTHPATKVFQALRIAVNKELEVLESVLPQAASLLSPGGLLAIITFHSLEDRIVKHFFRSFCKDNPSYTLSTKKPIIPSREEIRANRRSRSAKLRVIERVF